MRRAGNRLDATKGPKQLRMAKLWAEASLAGSDPATCPDHISPEDWAPAIAEVAHRRGWELTFGYDNQDRLTAVAETRNQDRGLAL